MPELSAPGEAKMESHSVAQAGVQCCDLGSGQSLPPRFNRIRFCHVGQADLELLTSGDPPTLASQSAGITGVSPHPGLAEDSQQLIAPLSEPYHSICSGEKQYIHKSQLLGYANKSPVAWVGAVCSLLAHHNLRLLGSNGVLLFTQAGCSGAISAHCNLHLLGSSNLPKLLSSWDYMHLLILDLQKCKQILPLGKDLHTPPLLSRATSSFSGPHSPAPRVSSQGVPATCEAGAEASSCFSALQKQTRNSHTGLGAARKS
ncbi:Protein GVQW1 [Plecturocebus cupreus]